METITTREKTLRMTLTGMFMAMNVILSMSIFSIPVPGGHLYFCDTVINTAAILLDPCSAFIVGGVGSFLGEFFFYPAPMFVSLVTHGLQAVVVSLISHRLRSRHESQPPALASPSARSSWLSATRWAAPTFIPLPHTQSPSCPSRSSRLALARCSP